jgi:predicted dehydrogenase
MILLDCIYINNGGGKILLDYLIEELEKKDLKVLYLFDKRMKHKHPIIKTSNKIIYINSNLISRFYYYFKNKNKFKKILCFGNIPPLIKCNAKVYTYFHQKLFLEIPSEIHFFRKLILVFKSNFFIFMIKNSDIIIVQSMVMKELLLAKISKLANTKVIIIPFYSVLENDIKIERKKNTFLYVSSGNDYKNHKNLLRAFCEFYDDNNPAELHLTVGNENKDLINKIIELSYNYPIFNHGFIDKFNLQILYKKSNFVIFPSLIESFGLGLIEGIIYGCKIIAADLPYTYAVCQPSIVFDPLSVSSIRLAIEESQTKNISKTVLITENRIDDLILLLTEVSILNNNSLLMKNKIIKLYRFIKLYGFERTIIKVASRLNNWKMKYLILKNFGFSEKKSISLIGCGQFGFATISYFILKTQGKRFLDCFDINSDRSNLTAKFYGYNECLNLEKLFSNPKCNLIYIASNHFSHAEYAIKALKSNKDVYIEKPISVSKKQYTELKSTIEISKQKVYFGYNRPFSKAIIKICSEIKNNCQPLSLNCFVSGHIINKNHWYRNPQEGTRICGNVGHWIDLMVHIMHKRGVIPSNFEICILQANYDEIDDNLSISIRTDFNDITNIFITSRIEPLEGINETINLQCGEVIAKIDDFTRMTIWKNEIKIKKKYYPKDVGHKLAILQPFMGQQYQRNFIEIDTSTLLMLEITEMVKNRIKNRTIKI